MLSGIEFELWTDCKALEFLFKPSSKPCARVERWVLRLQEFTYKIVHKPGRLNVADPLSRLCTVMDSDDVAKEKILIRMVEKSVPHALTPREIEEETLKDVELSTVKKALKSGNWALVEKTYAFVKNHICQVGGGSCSHSRQFKTTSNRFCSYRPRWNRSYESETSE